MKLVRADGHKQQQWALANMHTQKIAKLLSEHIDDDTTLIREVAVILLNLTGENFDSLDKKLAAIRGFYELTDFEEEPVSVPEYISELLHALFELYHQPRYKLFQIIAEQINSLRGAVPELLGLELIKNRYDQDDECANSRRFLDKNGTKITLQEVDIAAISDRRYLVEGYECKMNANTFVDRNRTDLEHLYETALEEHHQAHVGFISFDPSKKIVGRLEYLKAATYIHPYGVDLLSSLRNSPFDE